MSKPVRGLFLALLLLLLGAPGMAGEAVDIFDHIERGWSETDPVSALDPETFDPEAVDPEPEQELYDSTLYDAPVPAEAYQNQLYILDEQPEMLPSDSWLGEEDYGDGDMSIPRLFQFNFRKVICFYRGVPKSVATSGCGATSMSMVIAYLTGNKDQDPYTLFRWAISNGLYEGSGLTHEAVSEIGLMHGVGGTWMKPSEELIKSALWQGYPVIAHMGPGTFSKRGHYIVLRGVTEDGLIRVNDPNSLENSGAFTYDEIAKQTKSVDPFLICYRSQE